MCPSDHSSPNPPPTAPKRPVTPPKKTAATPAAAPSDASAPPANTGLAFPIAEGEDPKPSPIPPPSEALQYRAIGLVRGRYVPDVNQFTKGNMITSDGTTINMVLLGRVMSLLKKHVDLTVDHLWVVYPRTRAENLHMQIVGIWEPETLSKSEEDPDNPEESAEAIADTEAGDAEASQAPSDDSTTEETDPDAPADASGSKVINLVKPAVRPNDDKPVKKASRRRPQAIPYHVPEDGFSIRGEVILQSKDEDYVMVQIKQQARPPKHKEKAFKLRLEGLLGDRAVGHFWDIQVLRKDDKLTILSGTSMGALPPQKRKPGGGGGGGNKRKGRPYGAPGGPRGDRDRARPDAPRPSTPRPAKPRPKVQE